MRGQGRSFGARAALVATSVFVTFVVGAGVASAHVTVLPSSAPAGGFQILSFSVPNEKEDANTVKVEVQLPTSKPIASVSVKPMPGWDIETQTTTLAKPVKTDEGTVTQAVSSITWTAAPGQGLEPGEFDLFTISAGPLPSKPGKLQFKALQTYSDGDIVRWIEPTVKGAPEPENPAPTLTITKASSAHGH